MTEQAAEDPGQGWSLRGMVPEGSCLKSWFLEERRFHRADRKAECSPLPHSKPLPEGEKQSDGGCLQCHVASCIVRTQDASGLGRMAAGRKQGGLPGGAMELWVRGWGGWPGTAARPARRSLACTWPFTPLSSPLWLPVLKPQIDEKCECCHFNGSGYV